MTIKILKQGRLPEDIQYHFACYHCKTEFLATQKDGKLFSDQREGTHLEVACPLCQHKCSSWKEYKKPVDNPLQYPHGVRGWQDHVMESSTINGAYLPR